MTRESPAFAYQNVVNMSEKNLDAIGRFVITWNLPQRHLWLEHVPKERTSPLQCKKYN